MELWNAAVLPLCPLSSSPCCLLIYTGLSPTAPWFLPLVHDSKPWILLRSFLGSQYVPDQIDQASYSGKQAHIYWRSRAGSRSCIVIKYSSSEWVQEQPYTSQVAQGMCPIATQARPDSTYHVCTCSMTDFAPGGRIRRTRLDRNHLDIQSQGNYCMMRCMVEFDF
jgi:hypothetical protein